MVTRIKSVESGESVESEALVSSARPENRINGRRIPTEEELNESVVDRVAVALGDVAGDERAYIYVARLERGTSTWCQNYTPQQYEDGGLAMLRAEWGAGDYDIRLYATKAESGSFGIRARNSVSIATSKSALASAPAPAASVGIDPVMRSILENLVQSNAAIIAALSQSKPAPVEPIIQFQQMLGMLASMREVFQPAQAVPSKSTSLIEQLKEMREVQSLMGDGHDGDNLIAQLAPIVDLVKTAVEREKTSDVNIPVVAIPSSVTDLQIIMPFDDLLRSVENRARVKADPAQTAQFIVSNIPDNFADTFATIIESDDWLASLNRLIPNMSAHSEWLSLVRHHLIGLLFEPDSPTA